MAREYGRKQLGIEEPECVLPVSAHPAFAKAGHYLGVKMVWCDVHAETQACDMKSMKAAINANTVLLVRKNVGSSRVLVGCHRALLPWRGSEPAQSASLLSGALYFMEFVLTCALPMTHTNEGRVCAIVSVRHHGPYQGHCCFSRPQKAALPRRRVLWRVCDPVVGKDWEGKSVVDDSSRLSRSWPPHPACLLTAECP